jgi:hypothetical protein
MEANILNKNAKRQEGYIHPENGMPRMRGFSLFILSNYRLALSIELRIIVFNLKSIIQNRSCSWALEASVKAGAAGLVNSIYECTRG